jgi:catechol 2,3-dioxygenase-like lactoylglutathione lyase family enzyme
MGSGADDPGKHVMRRVACAAAVVGVLWASTPARAQLVESNQIGVTMGHVHLTVRDVEAHTKFFTEVLDGVVVKNGPLELIQFPGVFVMLRRGEPTGPPAGGSVNHFGFIVKDMKAALDKRKAAGVTIEPTENPNEVYVVSPENIRVEVYGEPAVPTSIAMNHIHFYPLAADVPAVKRWYVDMFGANPGRRPCIACLSNPRMIETGDLPGVVLSFSVGTVPTAPTKGRGLDHIGFEVKNLPAFVASLEAKGIKMEGPPRKVPGTNLSIAFLIDPWGTYIELTEGLAP